MLLSTCNSFHEGFHFILIIKWIVYLKKLEQDLTLFKLKIEVKLKFSTRDRGEEGLITFKRICSWRSEKF